VPYAGGSGRKKLLILPVGNDFVLFHLREAYDDVVFSENGNV
jgi:hypothetical protein